MSLPDLRGRLLYVLAMLAVFVFGCWIPVPDVDRHQLERLFDSDLFGLLDIFSGGALKRFSVFALGIMPYINASIIFQLLAIAVPSIQELSKEGEYGRQKISQYTRYLTVILAFLQAFGVTVGLRQAGIVQSTAGIALLDPKVWKIAITLSAGTAFLMWLGERITEKGVGNGVSMIIFAGIMARLPGEVSQTINLYRENAITFFPVLKLAMVFVGTIAVIILVQQGERRIPVRYADRVAGRKVIRGARTHLPLRVNQAGVIPIIFAISVVLFPATVAKMLPLQGDWDYWANKIADFFSPGSSGWAAFLYFLLVLGFTYFYTAVIFDPRDVADNLKKYGGQIQGFSPGLPTAQYLDRVLTRITFAGGVFLAAIALLQYYVPQFTGVSTFSLVGGTSLLIVVGVALETMQQIEQQLKLRQYEGFRLTR